jgi:chemotaxis protein MotB
MSSRRRGGGGGGGHDAGDNDERWLLTYSDLITLLLALFIVMWSISSVNISKFEQLKASLRAAFSGKILPANQSILQGQTSPFAQDGSPVTPIQVVQQQSLQPSLQRNIAASIAQAAQKQDVENLRALQRRVEEYARQHGFASYVRATIDERGLVVRLLTDKVLFTSGSAVLRPTGLPLLGEISSLLDQPDIVNPVRVEGNTDDVPIHTAEYASNWELSAARAAAVVEYLLGHGLAAHRVSLAGYADQHPVATNVTAWGRAANRRVDIVILRRTFAALGGSKQ